MTEYAVHPAAEIFPLMSDEEFAGLLADIEKHGLREPIVLCNGAVLDGRNRLQACEKLGVPIRFKEWPNNNDPHAYVISKNLHRRHLSQSQRAMIAGRIANRPHGNQGDVGIPTSPTVADAAAMLNINKGTVSEAKIVLNEGTPEEIKAVESGEAAVSTTSQHIRARSPKKQRTKKRAVQLSQKRINKEIWGRVRYALTHLTSLPRPKDVVSIVQARDKTGLVNDRLEQSLNWLKDFENEWNKRDQDNS